MNWFMLILMVWAIAVFVYAGWETFKDMHD
jgi:hypothetical protein